LSSLKLPLFTASVPSLDVCSQLWLCQYHTRSVRECCLLSSVLLQLSLPPAVWPTLLVFGRCCVHCLSTPSLLLCPFSAPRTSSNQSDCPTSFPQSCVDQSDHHTLVNTGERLVCERRVARRRGARARRSVRVSPIPNPDPNPNQAPRLLFIIIIVVVEGSIIFLFFTFSMFFKPP